MNPIGTEVIIYSVVHKTRIIDMIYHGRFQQGYRTAGGDHSWVLSKRIAELLTDRTETVSCHFSEICSSSHTFTVSLLRRLHAYRLLITVYFLSSANNRTAVIAAGKENFLQSQVSITNCELTQAAREDSEMWRCPKAGSEFNSKCRSGISSDSGSSHDLANMIHECVALRYWELVSLHLLLKVVAWVGAARIRRSLFRPHLGKQNILDEGLPAWIQDKGGERAM